MIAKLLCVGAGGFIGAIARYGLSGLVHRYYEGQFPYGTLFVNTLGCLLIGVMMSLVDERQLFGPEARSFLMIGLLGSFTTFSTFGYETVSLLETNQYRFALLSIAANVVVGIAAVYLGRAAVSSTT